MALLGFVGLSLLVGLSASAVTIDNKGGWYVGLARPPLAPPNWLFGPVWAVLFVMMGVAAWMVWRRPVSRLGGLMMGGVAPPPRGMWALTAWGWQLAVNATWSPVFFGLHLVAGGLVVLLVLTAAVTVTVFAFLRVDRVAGYLMLPYLGWVTFATYLNAGFWWLNR